MGGRNEMARNLLAQEPGQGNRHANAADTRKVAHPKCKRHDGGTPYRITPNAGEALRVVVAGRNVLRLGVSLDWKGGAA